MLSGNDFYSSTIDYFVSFSFLLLIELHGNSLVDLTSALALTEFLNKKKGKIISIALCLCNLKEAIHKSSFLFQRSIRLRLLNKNNIKGSLFIKQFNDVPFLELGGSIPAFTQQNNNNNNNNNK